jgi:hypothetical protein
MADLKKEFANHVADFITEHDLWHLAFIVVGFVVVCMGFGAFVFWLLKRQKIMAETRKIVAETETLQLTIRKDVQQYQDQYVTHSETLGLALRNMFTAIRARNADNLDQAREEAIRAFCTDFISSFGKYCELKDRILSGPERRAFAQEEVIPFLDTMLQFVVLVNKRSTLELLDRSPLILSPQTVAPYQRLVSANLPWCDLRTRWKLRTLILQFETEGDRSGRSSSVLELIGQDPLPKGQHGGQKG